MTGNTAGKTQDQPLSELVITRVFAAPCERVWRAWTEPEWIRRWWGPKGFTAPATEIDVRVGGRYRHCIRSANGMEIWSAGEVRVLIPMEHCVITDSFADADGNAVPAACYGFAEGWPLEQMVDLTFEDQGEKTKLTLIHSGFPTVLGIADARIGWENRSTSSKQH